MDNTGNEWIAGYDAAINDLAAFVKSRRFANQPLGDTKTIGGRMREARKKAGIAQQELADIMTSKGVKWAQATVWTTENDERKLAATEVVPLANALGVSPLYLLGVEE